MAATQKAVAMARVLAENLALRTGMSATSAVDASGNPTILLGTGVVDAKGVFIRIRQDYDPALELNGIGDAQRRYTPHVMEVVFELSATANIPDYDNTALFQLQVWKELVEHGTKIKLFLTTDGFSGGPGTPTVLNDVAWLSSTYFVGSVDNLWNPLTSTL